MLEWAKTFTVDQLGVLAKTAAKSSEEMYKKLKICSKLDSEITCLEGFKKETQTLLEQLRYEGVTCKILSVYVHQSDIVGIQHIYWDCNVRKEP